MGLRENLIRERTKRGLSQNALAKKAGVFQRTVRAIETGETKETRKVGQLAQALDVPVEVLLREGDDPPANVVLDEGRLVDIATVPNPRVAGLLRAATNGKKAEVWQLSTDLLDGAGYLRGDYVIVEPIKGWVHPGSIVLAEKHEKDKIIFLFRALFPPNLMLVTQRKDWPPHVRVEVVDDQQVIVRGVVTVKIG